METATWIIAAASILNIIVLAVYAYFTWGIWQETQRNAELAKQLTVQGRDGFKLQIVASYLQSREAALGFSVQQGSSEAHTQAELAIIAGVLKETFPDNWEALKLCIENVSRGHGPYISYR